MRLLSPLLVLSALADGTFLASFLKSLAAAGFPATAADLGTLLAAALVALYGRWSGKRKLRAEVQAALAEHVQGLPALEPKPKRKRKKINV